MSMSNFEMEWKAHTRHAAESAALRSAIKLLLMGPSITSWTVQGFGMMRTYLPFGPNPKRFRLNIWNADLAVLGVSTIHDHPWDFTSWIINGGFSNVRFVEDHFSGEEYEYMTIMCGIAGDNSDAAKGHGRSRMRLRELPVEFYNTGDIYNQAADEIHLSGYDPGTVTLNDRVGDTERARVFWPAGSAWVDAKPREATGLEILRTTAMALERWQDEIPIRD